MTEEEYFDYLVTQIYIAINNAEDFGKKDLCALKLYILMNISPVFKNKEVFEDVIKTLSLNKKRW